MPAPSRLPDGFFTETTSWAERVKLAEATPPPYTRVPERGLALVYLGVVFATLVLQHTLSLFVYQISCGIFALLWLYTGCLRWQLVPLIVSAGLLALSSFFQWFHATGVAVVAMILAVAGLLILHAMPVPRLPLYAPRHALGVTSFHWEDPSRPAWIEDPDDCPNRRQIYARVWYPGVARKGAARASWFPDALAYGAALVKHDRIAPFNVLMHWGLVMGNAYEDLDLVHSEQPWPVVLVSHGYTSSHALHTVVCENIAAQGFIVVGVDHAHDSYLTVFPNGDQAEYLAWPPIKNRRSYSSLHEYRHRQMLMRAHDLSFVLDRLEDLRDGLQDSVFAHALDLDAVAVLGHSFGGSSGFWTAATDQRVSAVIGLDPWMWTLPPDLLEDGLAAAMLVLQADVFGPTKNALKYDYFRYNKHQVELLAKATNTRAKHDDHAVVLTVDGALHSDFTDSTMTMRWPLRQPVFGKIDPYDLHHAVVDSIVSFLRHHLHQDPLAWHHSGAGRQLHHVLLRETEPVTGDFLMEPTRRAYGVAMADALKGNEAGWS